MTKERFDIHQHITDKIVSAIERGAGDFRLPWHRSAGNIMRPVNIASKKAYRGVNVVALWAYAEESGYSSGIWGTYRQWAEAGAQVRKGEKAAYVVFYKELEVASRDAATPRRTPASSPAQRRYSPPSRSTAISLRSIDAPPATTITPIEQAEAFVAATGASISHGGDPRLLSPFDGQHSASPARSLHRSADQHAGGSVLFDAAATSSRTGLRPRPAAIGSSASASAIRPMRWRSLSPSSAPPSSAPIFGITDEPRADHAQYLASWLSVMKADKKAIFTAASKASEAAAYLTGLQS